jgi:uncharacterized membrane protein (DUF4010 family)
MSHFDKSFLIKNIIIFLILGMGAYLSPDQPISEFVGISFKKIVNIVNILGIIQFLGIIIWKKMNSHAGVLLHGFISGLISSTALTISLAKRSKKMTEKEVSIESLSFLSATLAMNLQAMVFLILIANIKLSSVIILTTPILITLIIIVLRSIKTKNRPMPIVAKKFSWKNIIKLGSFICLILIAAHFGQQYFGNHGLIIVTFFVSLFEMHGSIVANSQLFVLNKISLDLFNNLLMTCIFSSYFSKILLSSFLGSSYTKPTR